MQITLFSRFMVFLPYVNGYKFDVYVKEKVSHTMAAEQLQTPTNLHTEKITDSPVPRAVQSSN